MARALRELTPEQAHYVLNRLLKLRKVSSGEVQRSLAEMQREIDSLEERLSFLRTLQKRGAGSRTLQATAAGRPRRRSAAAMASLKIQGRYLGLLRQIPPTRRGFFKKMAATQGREAAIRAMQAARK